MRDAPDLPAILDVEGRIPTRLRVHVWSHGLALERWEDDRWEPLEGDPHLFRLSSLDACPPRLRAVAESIPPATRALARPFEVDELEVLRLLAYPRGEELVRSAPTLAWLAAARLSEGGELARARLVGMRRREVLAFALNLPEATESMVRSTARIEIERYDAVTLGTIRRALTNPRILDAARTWRRWHVRDLELLALLPRLTRRPIALDMLDRARREGIAAFAEDVRFLTDTIRLGLAVGVHDPEAIVARLGTRDRIALRREQWLAAYRIPYPREWGAEPLPTSLPEPPLAGDDEVEAFVTVDDYVREGDEMSHCARSYVYRAARGEVALYRLRGAERATIEVRILEDGPELGHVLGPKNRGISDEARERVERWFERAVTKRKR